MREISWLRLTVFGLILVMIAGVALAHPFGQVAEAQDGLTQYQARHSDLVRATQQQQQQQTGPSGSFEAPYHDIKDLGVGKYAGQPLAPETSHVAPSPSNNIWSNGSSRFTSNQPTQSFAFESIDLNTASSIRFPPGTPPDTMGAVGPTQFATIQNNAYRWHDKSTGAVIGALDVADNTFWHPSVDPNDNAGIDPRVRFDRLTDKWVLSAFTLDDTNRIVFAISDGPVISLSTLWTYYYILPTGIDAGCFIDYPMLGIDINALYFGANMFDDDGPLCLYGNNTTAWVLPKSSLPVGGGNATSAATAFRNLFNAQSIWTPMPADNYDVTATQGYFIANHTGSDTLLRLGKVSNPGTSPSLSWTDVSINNKNDGWGEGVPYPGNPTPAGSGSDWGLDPLGFRPIGGAHVRNGSLWTTNTSSVLGPSGALRLWPNAGDRHSVIVFEIDVATSTALTDTNIYDNVAPLGGDPVHMWMGSVMVSGQGHVVAGFSAAAALSLPPSGGWAGRLATDPPGTFPNNAVYWTGTDTGDMRQSFETLPRTTRWGDYSMTSLDPCDDMTFWTIQEFQDSPAVLTGGNWATAVARIDAPPPPSQAAGTVPDVAMSSPSASAVITGDAADVAAGDWFYNTPATGMSASCRQVLTAAVVGGTSTGVTVNSVTYDANGQVTLDLNTSSATAGTALIEITNPDGQSMQATVNVVPSADVAITKTVDDDQPDSGQQIVYTLTVTNNGPQTANGVTVTDTLPSEVSYDSNDCGATNNPPFTWNIGTMANGANVQCNITVTVTVSVDSTFGNTASVTATDPLDPISGNNSDSVSVIVDVPTTIPTLLAPPDGSATNIVRPTFEWSVVPEAALYHFQLDDNADFSSPRHDLSLAATTFTPPYFAPLPQGDWHWRVRAEESTGSLSEWSDPWTVTIDTVPPGRPTLLTPVNEFNTDNNMPTFTWEAVPDANSYQIQIDTNQFFNTVNRVEGYSNTPDFTPGSPLVDQPWFWRVRAIDAAGNMGLWSTVWKVYIDAVPTPIPTLLTPTDGTVTNDRTPTFDWTDEVGVTRYNIQVDNEPSFTAPMRVNANPFASTFTPNLTPLADGTWYWQVRALGADGNWSNWSEMWSLTVDTIRPDRPTPTDPANGSSTGDNTPTFMWTGPGDAASYHIQLDTTPFFASANKVDGYSNTTDWTPALGSELMDGRWYWRVQAIDEAGNMSFWSAAFNVFIDAVPTPVPTLLAPANGTLSNSRVFTFDWTDEVGVKRYNLQVDNEPTFTPPMRVNVNVFNSTFTNAALPLGNDTWYWQVRAIGTDDMPSDWSPYWTLDVDTLRPDRPTAVSPIFNEVVHDSTPTFEWTAIPDAVSYTLQIDRNIYFLSPDKHEYQVVGTNLYEIPDTLYDGAWVWRVRAVDAAGNVSFWSPTSRVLVDAILTPVPTLLSPADDLLTNSRVFTFDWTDEVGVQRYNIQVDNEPSFTPPMRVNVNVLNSTFTNGALPLGNGTWYWQVRAQGTDGIWGDFSAPRSLEVDIVKPGRPTLLSPANFSTTADNTPEFTWNAVPDADVVGYIIQIDVWYYFVSPNKIQEQVVGTSFTPAVPLADRRWFWRVAAVDAAGNVGFWSPFWNVTVDTGASPSDADSGTSQFGNLTREQLIELWRLRHRGR